MRKLRPATILYLSIVTIVFLILLAVLIINPDGWRDFLLDIIFAIAIQTTIALVFFVIVYRILFEQIQNGLGKLNLWQITVSLFGLGTLLALPVLALIARRNVDIFDLIQTVGLVACFAFFGRPFPNFITSPSMNIPHLSRGFPSPRITQPQPLSIERLSPEERILFSNLVTKTFGNRESALRLVIYEQQHQPGLSTREYIQLAIDRWVQDNR